MASRSSGLLPRASPCSSGSVVCSELLCFMHESTRNCVLLLLVGMHLQQFLSQSDSNVFELSNRRPNPSTATCLGALSDLARRASLIPCPECSDDRCSPLPILSIDCEGKPLFKSSALAVLLFIDFLVQYSNVIYKVIVIVIVLAGALENSVSAKLVVPGIHAGLCFAGGSAHNP